MNRLGRTSYGTVNGRLPRSKPKAVVGGVGMVLGEIWRRTALAVAVLVLAAVGPTTSAMAAQVTGVSGSTTAAVASAPRAGIKLINPPATAASASAKTLAVGSNGSTLVVSPHPKVYLVFWGSQWRRDPAGAEDALVDFFTGLHGSDDTYDTILAQYCEGVRAGTTHCGAHGIHIAVPASSILGGTWTDSSTKAPRHATLGQVASEAVNAAAHFHNTTQVPNFNAQYVIVSPTGTHPDGFNTARGNLCAEHSWTSTSSGITLVYTNLPYVPDLGIGVCTTIHNPSQTDGLLSTETHEYAETVTDPVPYDGWSAAKSHPHDAMPPEIADECQNLDGRIHLSTGTFDVQGLWSNAANKCVTSAR